MGLERSTRRNGKDYLYSSSLLHDNPPRLLEPREEELGDAERFEEKCEARLREMKNETNARIKRRMQGL
jgi:hypothetical protein